MYKAKHGGSPPHHSQKLRKTVKQMQNDGWTPMAIYNEIVTNKECTAAEKMRLLREMHLEALSTEEITKLEGKNHGNLGKQS